MDCIQQVAVADILRVDNNQRWVAGKAECQLDTEPADAVAVPGKWRRNSVAPVDMDS